MAWGERGEEHGGARTRRRAFLTEDASERRTLICVVMGDSNKGQHPVVASETFVDIAAAQSKVFVNPRGMFRLERIIFLVFRSRR